VLTSPSDVPWTLTFSEVGREDLPRVGGKAANLGALTRAEIPVPPGFCVTTRAFDQFLTSLPDRDAHFDALDALDGTSIDSVRAAAEAIRCALDGLTMPVEVASAIATGWHALGTEHALAVRSSATAEDLPGASFAGQQDTYLNIRGEAALLEAVRKCWISLFTDRAVLYRARGGFGHRAVRLAVVVQRLVDPDISGIMFTADPITGHRHVASIDAGFGLGEALVSGIVSADLYRVDRRTGAILLARPGNKEFAVRSLPEGGTWRETLAEPARTARALTDDQVRALAVIGSRIESLYDGTPQDIEWCIADGAVYVVQARPITSLFPIPMPASADGGLRIFLSFGHFQMMLDAMPKLSLDVWRIFFPAGQERRPALSSSREANAVMVVAGSRLFIDATDALLVPQARRVVLGVLSHVYEALAESIAVLVGRPEFRSRQGAAGAVLRGVFRILGPMLVRLPIALLFRDPAVGRRLFDRALEVVPRESKERVRTVRNPADRIRQCWVELHALFGRVRPFLPSILAGIIAHRLLDRLARGRWADEVRDEVGLLSRGLPGNVTTEMDLAVGDLTDLARPYPELATLLRTVPWEDARQRLDDVAGGHEFLGAMQHFLSRYGKRGAREIDVSRPRWEDDPSLLLKVITGGLFSGNPGAHRRQHQAQVAAGESAAARLVAAAGRGRSGALRRRAVARLVRVARLGMGLREHPKFIIVQLLGVVRAEFLAAGEILAERRQLANPRDVWHLGFGEVATALDNPALDLREQVATRAAELRRDQLQKPPIVMSSEGEIPTVGAERSDLPEGALPGTAASSGVVEGLARVVMDPESDVLRAGEILVAPFTDPGWTPLFVHAVGLVTEVGGMMTHGAVVAREYGIPAVVSVASAIDRIKTGQRIRVDGTRGFVQILED
jgi:rifampicin phosphotransferase